MIGKIFKSKKATKPHTVQVVDRTREFLSAGERIDETGKSFQVKAIRAVNENGVWCRAEDEDGKPFAPFCMADDLFEECYEPLNG